MAESEVSKKVEAGPSEEIIRVILVDEREAMREELRHMLSRDESIIVIGETKDGKSALT